MNVTFHMARPLGGTGLSYIGWQTALQLQRLGLLGRVTVAACEANSIDPWRVRTIQQMRRVERLLALRGIRRLVRDRRLGYFLRYAAFDWLASRDVRPCDVFHGYPDESLRSARVARRQGACVVMDNVNAHPDLQAELMSAEYERLRIKLPAFNERRHRRWRMALAEADHVLVLSQFARQSFLDRGFADERLSVVPYGVDSTLFRPRPREDDVFRVLHMGQIGVRKGVQYLLDAWQRVSLRDAELVLVGWVHDDVASVLARYAGLGNVRIKRQLTDMREIAAEYSHASVFVAASIEDGWAMTVTEAMASGLPVIVTENTGARDAVRDGVDGFSVPSHSSEALAEAIHTMYRHPAMVQEMGAAARERAREFTWERYGDGVASAYERALEHARGGDV